MCLSHQWPLRVTSPKCRAHFQPIVEFPGYPGLVTTSPRFLRSRYVSFHFQIGAQPNQKSIPTCTVSQDWNKLTNIEMTQRREKSAPLLTTKASSPASLCIWSGAFPPSYLLTCYSKVEERCCLTHGSAGFPCVKIPLLLTLSRRLESLGDRRVLCCQLSIARCWWTARSGWISPQSGNIYDDFNNLVWSAW